VLLGSPLDPPSVLSSVLILAASDDEDNFFVEEDVVCRGRLSYLRGTDRMSDVPEGWSLSHGALA